nr:glycosyltransferase family 4 protein [Halobellus ruber]
MANFVGAEFIKCRTKGIRSRLQGAHSHSFEGRPVLLEGGVPLLEGIATKFLSETGPIIALGADSTYDDLLDPLPGRTTKSRLAHRVSLPFVDGTLAVSERIATLAQRYSGGPVRIIHPFVQSDRYERLRGLDTTPEGNRILCVGKYRSKNGQDILLDAISRVDADVRVDFAGPDTEQITEQGNIHSHGFVSEEKLYELFRSAALIVFPAPVGAFPVITLEGLCAGLPVVVTSRIGTATLIRGIDGRLIADPTAEDLARAIRWYFKLSPEIREELAQRADQLGVGFRESEGLETFGFEFARLLRDVGFEGTIND